MDVFIVVVLFVIAGMLYDHFNEKAKKEYQKKKNQERENAAKLKKKEKANLSGFTSSSELKTPVPPKPTFKANNGSANSTVSVKTPTP